MTAARVVEPLFWPRALALLPRTFEVTGYSAAVFKSEGIAVRVRYRGEEIIVWAWRLRQISERSLTPQAAAAALTRLLRRASEDLPGVATVAEFDRSIEALGRVADEGRVEL